MVDSRKAQMGIGTLIIFIAMILVAAVAAGVVIRTAGVLQQKAYAVGAEARQSILSLIDISNVVVGVNLTTETTNEFEIMIRLSPGSYPIPFKTTGFSFYTNNLFVSAKLQDSKFDEYKNNTAYSLENLNSTYMNIGDLDFDGLTEEVKIVNSSNESFVQFALSTLGTPFNVSLGTNLSVGTTVDITDLPILNKETGDILGFMQISGTVTNANTFDGLNAYITQFPVEPSHQTCNFDNLIPERYYCIQIAQGNSNSILESGEIFEILFKLKSDHSLSGDTQYGFSFTPKQGQVTELSGKLPQVLNKLQTVVYPQ